METVQQAGEPRLRFESVLSELLARVDDDALVGRVQDAWAALRGFQQAGEPTDALAEVREWHLDQAMWHRHAAEFGTAEDQSEPTRSMLLTAAALHERFAAALVSRPQQPQAETPLTDEACQPNGLMFDAFGEPRARYVRVTLDGAHCVMHPSDGASYLADAKASDDHSAYIVRDVYLSEREFEDLGEFDGF